MGRQLEWKALVGAAAARQKRVLSLIGSDGLGKTSLALAAAHYLYERHAFVGGVFFVSVAGAASATAAAVDTTARRKRRRKAAVLVSSSGAGGGGGGEDISGGTLRTSRSTRTKAVCA